LHFESYFLPVNYFTYQQKGQKAIVLCGTASFNYMQNALIHSHILCKSFNYSQIL